MYDCESCVPKINVKADGKDQAVSGQPYDMIAVQVVDPNSIHVHHKKGWKADQSDARRSPPTGRCLPWRVPAILPTGASLTSTKPSTRGLPKGLPVPV